MRDLIGRTLGHYRVVEKIGAGGMGVVYRARDERLDRDVAIKVLPEEVAQTRYRLDRFEREAKAVAKLDHPNILAIHDFGTDDGVTYAVTELLEGENLRDRIPASGMGWQTATEIGAAVADGLAAAHGKGIIHRDLKPENIYLTADGRVKILDFGLAQIKEPVDEDAATATLTPAGTLPGTVMGTMGYMSPEQLRGEPADGRSDIFALGCVLYETLSGRQAFIRKSTAETSVAILREDPPALTASGIALPAELERTVRRCLEKNAEARFQSASDLAYNLRSITTDHAVPVAKPTAVTAHRRRASSWAAVFSVGLILVIGAVVLGPRVFDRKSPADNVAAIRTLAVLPLQNLSGSPDQEFFADGMTEALITELGKISSIDVIGRHSVMRYKGSDTTLEDIAEDLDVDAFVVGSTASSGGRVRVAIQLTLPHSDRLIWSESYESELEDILALQGDVARAIAREIQVGLTPDEEKRLTQKLQVKPEAHEEYMRGLHSLSRFKYVEGLEHFEQAVKMDPDFAEAHATMASILILVGSARPLDVRADFGRRARQSVEKALILNPDLSEAHRALGNMKAAYDWDWSEAEAAHRRAVELNSNSVSANMSLGLFLVYLRRFDEGIEWCEAAQKLDPFSLETNIWLAAAYVFASRFDESITRLEFIRGLDPGWGEIHHCLGITYAAKGLWEEAVDSCNRYSGYKIPEYCGSIYARTGHRDQALERLQFCTTGNDINPLCMAGIKAGLGEIDEALDWLETAYGQRRLWLLPWMRLPILSDGLREDPRFQDIERRMGLPEN